MTLMGLYMFASENLKADLGGFDGVFHAQRAFLYFNICIFF